MPRRRAQNREVTIFDVAQKAGVAIATVSRILRGSGAHAERTKKAVLAAAESLRYRPNSAARNLSSRTTDLIAVCGWFLGKNEATFPAELVLKGIMQGLQGTRYGLFMVQRQVELNDHREILQGFSRQRFVSGSIWINSHVPKQDLALLRRSRAPLVQVETRVEGSDSVTCDNVLGGKLGIGELLSRGCHELALILGQANPAQDERVKGCRQALRDAGIPWKQVKVYKALGFDYLGGLACATEIAQARARGAKIDGVFSLAGDKPALGLMQGLKEHGIQVPKDVAVVGYDGMPESAYSDPALTTVKQPLYEMGQAAAQLLCARLADDKAPYQSIRLAPKIEKRRSA